ncbi:MAG: hypothetical protein FWD43_00375 [Coriobacteriia bacterium]|nr:hypothetical protein [Coriobacteriia bacterium]
MLNKGVATFSPRRQNVLQALVNEYIESAHPVGSKQLVNRYFVDVSSATVRSELMWLEDRGYVISPHTSAGRIPTNIGYRSFVNSLLLYPGTTQLFSNTQAQPQIKSLSGATHRTQEFLQPTSRSSHLPNKKDILDDTRSITDILGFLSDYVSCLAVAWIPKISSTIYHRGLPMLMMQPEFRTTAAALPLIQLLESQGDLISILKDDKNTHGLHIRIGTEHEDSQLFSFSMVASRVVLGEYTGVIALFGPTRMDYRKAIGALSAVINNC